MPTHISEQDSAANAGEQFARVAEFVLDTNPNDIPATLREQAAYLFLDTIGVCIGAAPMQAGRIARDIAAGLYAAGDPALAAPMLFDGREVSLAGMVYAGATQIDNLDGHDGYNPTKGHIGVVMVPTLAGLAHNLPNLSGPAALASLVIGYEVAGRAGIALHASACDYHTSGAWNALGVAAMTARLRGQPPEQLRQALGIAEYHGPRSQMMREIASPTMLHDGSGWGGLAGISAAVLAHAGFTGAPALTVEAPDAAIHWQDLGQFWQTDHQYIKPYPICRWAHAAIDAVQGLCREHDIGEQEIENVRVRSFDYAAALFPGMPETTSQAQYSLPFAIAAMIVHGRIGLEQISGKGLSDPKVARLVDATELIADPRHEQRFPQGRWADVELILYDGRVLASGDVHAAGGPERPFSRDDIIAKYLDFACPVLGQNHAELLRDAILNMTSIDSKFSEVAQYLYKPV